MPANGRWDLTRRLTVCYLNSLRSATRILSNLETRICAYTNP